MISVIIPTINAEATLPRALAPLVPAAVDGVVKEVIVADGGSADRTCRIADDAGATVVTSVCGRGAQLIAGADAARQPWLLFLHADTVLDEGWHDEAVRFMTTGQEQEPASRAGIFRFALDDYGLQPRLLEKLVRLRSRWLALPYGDQGLLISRQLHNSIGGYKDFPMMEDVDIIWRLGRRRLHAFHGHATTSAIRYRRDGYASRSARNLACLVLYAAGVSPQKIVRLYG